MTYDIDRSLAHDGIYTYTTDKGTSYMTKLSETAIGSGLWTMDFIKLSGEPNSREIFTTMNTLMELSLEYLDSKNAKLIVFFINGENREEIDQKTRIFARWIKDNCDYEIIPNPIISIPNKRNGIIEIPTNAIYMKRNKITTPPDSTIKYCTNCGTVNNNFTFCPNCGTNLK